MNNISCVNINNPNLRFQLQVVGEANLSRIMTALNNGNKSLTDSREYEQLVQNQENIGSQRKIDVINKLAAHCIYLDREHRIEAINSTISEALANQEIQSIVQAFNNDALKGFSAHYNDGKFTLEQSTRYGELLKYEFDSTKGKLVPVNPSRNHLDYVNGLWVPSSTDELDNFLESLKDKDGNKINNANEVKDTFVNTYFLGDYVNQLYNGKGELSKDWLFAQHCTPNGTKTSFDKAISSGKPLEVTKGSESISDNLAERLQQRKEAIDRICGLSNKYNISQADQIQIVEYIANRFCSIQALCVNDTERFLKKFAPKSTDDSKDKIRNYAKENKLEKIFTGEFTAEILNKIRNSIQTASQSPYAPEGLKRIGEILSSDTLFETFLPVITTVIKNLNQFNIKLNTFTLEEDIEDSVNKQTPNESVEDTNVDSEKDSDSMEEIDAVELSESDSNADFIQAHIKSLNQDILKSTRKEFSHVISGIHNSAASEANVEYGLNKYYDPANILQVIRNICITSKDADEMMLIISNLPEDWAPEVHKRLSENNKIRTKLFRSINGQLHKYLGFFVGKDDKLHTHQANRKSIQGAEQEVIKSLIAHDKPYQDGMVTFSTINQYGLGVNLYDDSTVSDGKKTLKNGDIIERIKVLIPILKSASFYHMLDKELPGILDKYNAGKTWNTEKKQLKTSKEEEYSNNYADYASYLKKAKNCMHKSIKTFYDLSNPQSKENEVLSALGLSGDSTLYALWNAIAKMLGVQLFGENRTLGSNEEAWLKLMDVRTEWKTNKDGKAYTVGVYTDNLAKLITKLESFVKAPSKYTVNLYEEITKVFIGSNAALNYYMHTYLAGDQYFSITYDDLISRLDKNLHQTYNERYSGVVNMGKKQEQIAEKFKKRYASDTFLQALASSFDVNSLADCSNKGESPLWVLRLMSSNPSNFPKLFTFIAQEGVKFSELADLSHLAKTIVAFSGKDGYGNNNLTPEPYYPGPVISDKGIEPFWRDKNVYSPDKCVEYMANIAAAELVKIKQVYKDAKKVGKPLGEYYPKLNEDGTLDMSKLNQCKFGFMKGLNNYLQLINYTDQAEFDMFVEDANGKSKFETYELALIRALHNFLYSDNENTVETASVNFAANVIDFIQSTLDAECEKLLKRLYDECIPDKAHPETAPLLKKMGFILNEKHEFNGQPLDVILDTPGQQKLTFEQFKEAFEIHGHNSIQKFRASSISKFIKYYVYNNKFANVNMSIVFNLDDSIYKDAVTATKRGGQLTAKGAHYDMSAIDSNGRSYEDRVSEYHGYKTFICLEDVEVSPEKGINRLIAQDSANLYEEFFEFYRQTLLNRIDTNLSAELKKAKQAEIEQIINDRRTRLHQKLCATDGQSWVTPKALRRLRGMLQDTNKAQDEFLRNVEKLYDKAAGIIKKYRKEHPDKNYWTDSEAQKVLINQLQEEVLQGKGGFLEIKNEYVHSDEFLPNMPEKQFTSGAVSHSDIERVLLTQVKNSELCPLNLADLINRGDFFMIQLVSLLQRAHVDANNPPSTIKNGRGHTFSLKCNNPDDIIDQMEGELLKLKGEDTVPNTESNFVYKVDAEDNVKQQEIPAHGGTKDTLGMQIVKLLPSYINFNDTYQLPNLTGSSKIIEKSGSQLYQEYFNILTAKYAKSFDKLYKKFGIDPNSTTILRLQNGQNISEQEKMKIFGKMEEFITEDIMRTQLPTIQHLAQYFVQYTKEGGVEFTIPFNEGMNQNLVSKILASALKKAVVRQKIQGGQYVQATDVLTGSFIDKYNGREYSSKELKVVKKEINGVTHYYCEARFPASYKKAIGKKAYDNETGQIDMDKVPEYLKHAIMYRIPTETMHSIFHVRAVEFLSEEAGDIVQLPAELPTIAGIDFDIDKLFSVMATLTEKLGGGYKYETSDMEFDSYKELESLSENCLDNMLFERMLAMVNNKTHSSEILDGGGYADVKRLGYRVSLLTTYSDSLTKYTEYSVKDVYATNQDGTYVMSDEVVQDIISCCLDAIDPSLPSDRIGIITRNSVGATLKGMFADANTLHGQLSKKNIKINVKNLKRSLGNIKVNGEQVISRNVNLDYDSEYGFDNINKPMNFLSQLLAASLDNAKDPVLVAMGINEATAPIAIHLLRLGFSMKTVAGILAQPICKKLTQLYNVDKAQNPDGYHSIEYYLDGFHNPNSKASDINLNDETLFDPEIVTKSYDELNEDQQKMQSQLIPLISLCCEINSEFFTVKSILKRDTQSDPSYTSLYGIIAASAKIDNYLHKNASNETIFTDSISKMFDPESEIYTPNLDYLNRNIKKFLEASLNTLNPTLGTHLYQLSMLWLQHMSPKLNEEIVERLYQHYCVDCMVTYFRENNIKVFDQYRNSEDILTTIHTKSLGLRNQAKELITNYEGLENNTFLSQLEVYEPRSSMATNALKEIGKQRKEKVKYYYLGIDSKYLQDYQLLQITDDLTALFNKAKDPNTDPEFAQKLRTFLDEVFALAFVRNPFSTVTYRSPLRFLGATSKQFLFDGKYLKCFQKGFTNEDGLHEDKDLIFLQKFAQHNPYYLLYDKSAKDGDWCWSGYKNGRTYIVKKGKKDALRVQGITGYATEYVRGDHKTSVLMHENAFKQANKNIENGINQYSSRTGALSQVESMLSTVSAGTEISSISNISRNNLAKVLDYYYGYSGLFKYKEREYNSVFHAYQTYKSGSFDQQAYDSNGTKPNNSLRVSDETNQLEILTDIQKAKLYANKIIITTINKVSGVVNPNKPDEGINFLSGLEYNPSAQNKETKEFLKNNYITSLVNAYQEIAPNAIEQLNTIVVSQTDMSDIC